MLLLNSLIIALALLANPPIKEAIYEITDALLVDKVLSSQLCTGVRDKELCVKFVAELDELLAIERAMQPDPLAERPPIHRTPQIRLAESIARIEELLPEIEDEASSAKIMAALKTLKEPSPNEKVPEVRQVPL
jgi:hypothetical protein